MTAQEQPQARTWTEAPASVTVRALGPTGFDIMLTLRADNGSDLLPKLNSALDWLQAQGYTPTGNGHQEAAPEADDAAEDDAPLHDERGRPFKVCGTHNAKMYRRERDGQVWYSHRLADGSWCKGGNSI